MRGLQSNFEWPYLHTVQEYRRSRRGRSKAARQCSSAFSLVGFNATKTSSGDVQFASASAPDYHVTPPIHKQVKWPADSPIRAQVGEIMHWLMLNMYSYEDCRHVCHNAATMIAYHNSSTMVDSTLPPWPICTLASCGVSVLLTQPRSRTATFPQLILLLCTAVGAWHIET